MYTYLIFLSVSFGASVIGAICGIGGGVLIKPILDACGVLDVASISFLSSCTVLAMSCFSVVSSVGNRKNSVDLSVSTPLGIGAAIGGVAGRQMFQILSGIFADSNRVGAVQSACLFLFVLGPLIYTLNRGKIVTKQIRRKDFCIFIGIFLGMLSSFLAHQSGGALLFLLHGNEDGGCQRPVCDSDFPDGGAFADHCDGKCAAGESGTDCADGIWRIGWGRCGAQAE